MKLGTRVSLFFLGSMAVVLIGFSTTLYILASKYLDRQIHERLEGGVNTIIAAAEVSADRVEWEPRERFLSFGQTTLEGNFVWAVSNPQGEFVDTSSGLDPTDFFKAIEFTPEAVDITDATGAQWRVLRRTIVPRADAPADEPALNEAMHKSLMIHAAISLNGLRSTLRTLTILLITLPLGIWSLALVFGRRLVSRALRPLTDMAEFAHTIDADDTQSRFPTRDTGDELDELGLSFNALLDRLRESQERQRRFTGEASHQLRTPLTVIQGQVDLVLRQERPVEEYRRVLRLVRKKSNDLTQIVESLLFLSRTDADGSQLAIETLDIVFWLTKYLETWTHPRQADLAVQIDSNAPLSSRVHPILLGELLTNLLDNAAKYSEPGTRIDLRLSATDTTVMLSVEDRGIGIKGDEIPHLFETFYRADAARRGGKAGVGLGLAVAARLARSLGGSIDVESRVGVGSRFSLRLPRTEKGSGANGTRIT